jgi:hypothetical protein
MPNQKFKPDFILLQGMGPNRVAKFKDKLDATFPNSTYFMGATNFSPELPNRPRTGVAIIYRVRFAPKASTAWRAIGRDGTPHNDDCTVDSFHSRGVAQKFTDGVVAPGLRATRSTTDRSQGP